MTRSIDLMLFAISVVFNLLVTGVFAARRLWGTAVERSIGIALLALAVPAAVAAALNAAGARSWWTVLLPSLLVAHGIVELFFDYLLPLNWRAKPALAGPYLALFYTAQIGMVGYSFSVGKPQGFIALATYFLSLAATAWGHGPLRRG